MTAYEIVKHVTETLDPGEGRELTLQLMRHFGITPDQGRPYCPMYPGDDGTGKPDPEKGRWYEVHLTGIAVGPAGANVVSRRIDLICGLRREFHLGLREAKEMTDLVLARRSVNLTPYAVKRVSLVVWPPNETENPALSRWDTEQLAKRLRADGGVVEVVGWGGP